MTHARRVALAGALDLAAVVVFVVVGRRSHDEGDAFTEFVKTLGPFVIALAAGWLLTRAWRSAMAIGTGAAVWATTVVLGMVLRRVAFDRGTAPSFVIVTTIFLGLCLLGWRAIARLLGGGQNSTATAGTS